MNVKLRRANITTKIIREKQDSLLDNPPVADTMEERLAMVWPLTKEALAISGEFNAEQRLQRHVTRFVTRKR
jgi:hypothetical protein